MVIDHTYCLHEGTLLSMVYRTKLIKTCGFVLNNAFHQPIAALEIPFKLSMNFES